MNTTTRNEITTDCLTLKGGGYDYHIHRDRLRNAAQLVHWLAHLESKQWFNLQDVKDLLRFARQNGMNPWEVQA